jgi:hypothetical protein
VGHDTKDTAHHLPFRLDVRQGRSQCRGRCPDRGGDRLPLGCNASLQRAPAYSRMSSPWLRSSR